MNDLFHVWLTAAVASVYKLINLSLSECENNAVARNMKFVFIQNSFDTSALFCSGEI